ncbi:MAG TPA: LamG-like jellyroll fold domain-containing protein, partial [Candidatus Paceibacterota bacterium]|nr:LamG-like jellyroll fold domain-containing protein [Candidatus Paceibacterota bacterium]
GSDLNLSPLFSSNGLVGYWKFDEGQGTSTQDSSGNGNTGTWNGTLGSQWTTGKIGGAGQFNSSLGNYVNIPDSTSLHFGTNSFTVSLWMQFPTGAVNPYWSFGKGNGYSGVGYGIAHWTTGNPISPGMFVDDGSRICSPSCGVSSYAASVARGNWIYYTWVIDRNADVVKEYSNGVYGSSVSIAGLGTFDDTASPLELGGMGGNRYNGKLDDVRIYNRALSAAEIMALYNATK